MRRILSLAVALTALAAAGSALAQSMPVRIDQAARVSLSASARDVIIGNPAIADVTVIDARNLLVTGKSFGVTNLVVIDGRGRTILDRQIVVSAGDEGRVSIYRGAGLQDYACSVRCQSTGEAAPAPTPAPVPNSQ